MGNSFSPCIPRAAAGEAVKLVFWGGGATRLPGEAPLAGAVMVEHPDHVVCPADNFYIGHPLPVLEIEDRLAPGRTYLVIPVDRLPPSRTLTAASLSALSASPRRPLDLGKNPFRYTKSAGGKTLIQVSPELVTAIISPRGRIDRTREGRRRPSGDGSTGGAGGGLICSSPELQRQYAQLVTSRAQQWSPKLETISERKARLSPSRILGFERR